VTVFNERFSGFVVDGHADEGVDERYGVGSGFLGGKGYAADGCDVGRQFDHEVAPGQLAEFGDDFKGCVAADAHDHAFAFDVGTGEIDFVCVEAFDGVEPGDHFAVVVDGAAGDVDDDRRAESPQKGDFFGDKSFNPDIGKPDGVDHAGRGFGNALGRISGSGFERDRFGDDSPDFSKVAEPAELFAVRYGA